MSIGTLVRRILGLDALRDPSYVAPPPPVSDPSDLALVGLASDEPVETTPQVTFLPVPQEKPEPAAVPTLVVSTSLGLTMLLVTSASDEPSYLAWRQLLEREGVPFTTWLAGQTPLRTDDLVDADGHGRFQAIVLATDMTLSTRGGEPSSCFSADECTILQDYQRSFGVRQVTAYAVPAPVIGLSADRWSGDVSGSVAHLTDDGHALFTELAGPIPLSAGTYGYWSEPLPDAAFATLVASPSGAPVVGVITHADGREELIVTVASGPFSRHMHLLGHGMLGWATRGLRLGRRDFFLTVQVDDLLLGAPVPLGADPIRMTAQDVDASADWSHATQVRLDLAFNAWGSVSATADGSTDELTEALLAHIADFHWLNHTFGHLDLDLASAEEIHDEIVRNVGWAAEHWLPVELDALVTGAHTGLENPELPATAYGCGIRWLASDASHEPEPRLLGAIRTVPRHPVNIPLDVTTARNWVGAGDDESEDGLWLRRVERLLTRESQMILDHVLSNDPRPHYSHQNALIGERLLLTLLSRVMEEFRSLVRQPVVQLSMSEVGAELDRMRVWQQACADGSVVAVQDGGAITIRNDSERNVHVPFTDERAEAWASRPGWVLVGARSAVTVS